MRFSRGRKSPSQQKGSPRSLLDLEDDVLILIYSQCRIDELLNLRLISSESRSFIDTFFAAIGPHVARNTFPSCKYLLAKHASTLPFTFQDLKALIPKHLASILVDKHRFAFKSGKSNHGIPAESPVGDVLRDRIANGFRILQNLYNISRDEYGRNAKKPRMSTSSLVDKVLHPSQFRLEALKSTEDVILQKRLEYINHLTRKQAEDYKLLLTILPSAFCTSLSNVGDEYVPWIFDFGAGIGCQRQVRMGKSWMSWYILSEGLDPFWQQWWSLPHDDRATENYIRDRAIKAFTNTPEKLADHHRLVALQLQTAVNELVTTDSGDIDLNSFSPVRYFAEYRLVKRYREQDGLPPVLETLEHVPFLINFRCPEERLRMIESARGQAYARESAQGRQ